MRCPFHHSKLDLQLVAHFWDVREPLGGGGWLTELHPWVWAVSIYSFSLVPVHLVCSVFVLGDVISQLPALAARVTPSLTLWTVVLWNRKPE